MSKTDDTSVNWEPYEAEIISLYVDQDHTLKATMTHMREKYGLRATDKQYKTKFLGYKNMKAPEWGAVGQEVRKRTLEGKESDVFLHGRRLDPKRVKTGIARYQSSISDPDSETVIGTSCQDRIYIRTPPAPSASPLPPQAPVAQHVSLGVCNDFFTDMTVIDMDSGDLTGELYQYNSPIFTGPSSLVGRIITEDTHPQHTGIIGTPPLFENFDFDMFLEFQLIKNLPWFQLQNIMENLGCISVSPVMDEVFRASLWPSSPFGPFNLNRTNLALEERHSLLSGFLGSASKQQVGEYVPHFTANLQRLVPERQEGELPMKVQQLFDPSNKHPLYQLFEFAMYFSSNNMLTPTQTDVFLKWIIDQKYTDLLKSFLQIKTPTIQAFSTRILESGIRIKDTKFLQLLMTSGVKFDRVLEQAIQINDLQFLTLLIGSGVDSSLLSGTPGGRLLHKIAATHHTKIAQILIQYGAYVNLPVQGDMYTTSLYEAVQYNNIDMVKCLLNAGAWVGTRCRSGPDTALSVAVYYRRLDIVLVLLEKGANMHGCQIYGKDILEWSALNARDIYQVLLEKTGKGDQPLMISDIIYAAEGGTEAFSRFLRRHQTKVPQVKLEKALRVSVNESKFRATLALLGNGVDPNGPTLDNDDRPLISAAYNDDITYSKLLINAGATVNLPGLLVLAVEQENFELLRLLIEAGADLEIYGPEALEEAAAADSVEMAALLLDNGTAVNAFGNPLTGLQAARNIEFAQYLIERGANVNVPASAVRGRTALQAAAEIGEFELVIFLLNEHADVNATPAIVEGLTALEAAISGSGPWEIKGKIFKILLEHGASINRPFGQGYRNTTILHDLIEQNQGDLICLAVETGVNINSMSFGGEGRTPLQLAAAKGNLDVVKLLLEHGAEVNAPPGHLYGRTALQAAASAETPNMELAQLLIDNHANINATAGVKGGVTALQGAAIRGHIKIALMLLQKGADVNARPAIKDGRTAIEGAAEHGRLDMVQLLLNAGAKGDVTRKTGFKRAIELAEKNRHFVIAQVLRDQRANEGESSAF